MDGLVLINKVKKLNPKVRTMSVSAYDFKIILFLKSIFNKGS